MKRVLDHYENRTDDEAVAEDEAAFAAEGETVMVVPTELVPEIRELIARRRGAWSTFGFLRWADAITPTLHEVRKSGHANHGKRPRKRPAGGASTVGKEAIVVVWLPVYFSLVSRPSQLVRLG